METPAARTADPAELIETSSVPPPAVEAAGEQSAADWNLSLLAGRLVEITAGPGPRTAATSYHRSAIPSIWDIEPSRRDRGSAALTTAAGLVWKAQHAGEPVAWIGARPSFFFPPDFASGGIDLAALVVVRAPNASSAARAADKLLRSGAFGLVVLDLGAHAAVPSPLLGRLLGLAQKHHATVVFLTEKPAEAPSLAPIVSLRVSASRWNRGAGLFACTVTASKDKRRAPGWTLEETFRGPPGLR